MFLAGVMSIRAPPKEVLVGHISLTTMQVNICKSKPDVSRDSVNQYLECSSEHCMPCRVSKCQELCFQKRRKASSTPIDNIKQVSSLKILGITFQNNSRFNEHIRNKMLEANRYLYVLRSVRKEGYIDHLFTTIVLPKISLIWFKYLCCL